MRRLTMSIMLWLASRTLKLSSEPPTPPIPAGSSTVFIGCLHMHGDMANVTPASSAQGGYGNGSAINPTCAVVLPMRSIHLSILLTSAPLRHPYLPSK